MKLTRRLVPALRHRGLDQVSAFFGVANPARHRAFGDALTTAYVLRSLRRSFAGGGKGCGSGCGKCETPADGGQRQGMIPLEQVRGEGEKR